MNKDPVANVAAGSTHSDWRNRLMVATLGKPVSRTRPLFGLVLALLWVFAVGPFTQASAQTSQEKWAAKRANSPFNLASGPSTVLEANLVQCGIDNFGN